MRAQLLHLSGPLRGRTITYDTPVVALGAGEGVDARLPVPGVAERHAEIHYVVDDCQFRLRRGDGQVFVNGSEVEEVVLEDGDELELGAGGPKLRFRIYVPVGAVCKPVRRMLSDARAVGRVSGSISATRTLTRDLLTQATLTLKVGFPLLVVAGAFLAGWLGGWLGSRPSIAERQRASAVAAEELARLRAEQSEQQAALQKLAAANATVRRIQREWSRGVCLVHGIFGLRGTDGTWFSADGKEPLEVEYTGSGFLVSASGYVVTNRHVVAPWTEMAAIQPLLAAGLVPEFRRLDATFPGLAPIPVASDTIRRRTDDLDVAVCMVDPAAVQGVPVLPMHDGPLEGEDQRAVVVGYPTGLAALLARAEPALVESLQQQGASMTEAIARLAAAGQVTPILTQGVVSNVQEQMIVYDAPTTHGGSGGPVFGADGEVIAVNFGILPQFGGANFGVPVRYARELLPR